MTTSPPEREEPAASRLGQASPGDACPGDPGAGDAGGVRFALRPEIEADAPFRLALFRASRGPGWDQIPLPADMLTKIMEQQFHAQTQGYRAAYPQARLEIITIDGIPVGRLATDRAPNGPHLIDIAVIPERRGQGIGEAILRTLMDEAAASGTSVTLQVAVDNLGAQRLYHRLGFVMTAANDTHLTLCWPASPPNPEDAP